MSMTPLADTMLNPISLVGYHFRVDSESPKRRRREPRVRDNPMARIAHEVMVEAERTFRRADALSAGMEPCILERVDDSAITGYTNDRQDRNVPPGDVLLAATLAAGVSLGQKLGLAGGALDAELREMRAQIAEMREEMATMRDKLSGEPDDAKARRRAQRLAWAQPLHGGGDTDAIRSEPPERRT